MRNWIDLFESRGHRLGDFITAKTNDRDADFWIVRRSSADLVGEPKKEFDPERIGIKVVNTEALLPDYLYYVMQHLWMTGRWRSIATGTTRLVSIKTGDILNIPLG